VQSHVLKEFRQFGLQTQQGTVDLATDTAQKNWDKPDIIDAQVASAKAAVWKAGQIAGDPASMVQAKTQQVTSKIHYGVVETALQQNNPLYAQRYIDKYKDDMTAGDLLKATGQITADTQARMATGAAQTAITHYAKAFAPTDVDRMLTITKMSESGNRDTNADGTPVTSPKGAMYGMQVMPATAKNPGYGIKPAADNSPTEYNRVGTEYLAAMVKTYAGDAAKAWAAYNAGPAAVDKAVKADGANWLAKMPAETQAYVAKNVAQLQDGGGAPALPTMQDIHNNIREQLGPNAQPKVVKAALDEGTRQYNDAMNARKQQAENAVQQVQQYLIQNKGDFTALPPALKASIVTLAPEKWDNLQSFAKAVANPPKSDNMAAYHEAIDRPDLLAKMGDAQFTQFVTTNFGEATQKQIATLRQEAKSGKTGMGADDLNSATLTSELDNRLTSIGLAKPKPNASEDDKAQYGTIQKFLADGVLAQQAQLGRKMTEKEVIQYVDQQFLKNYQFRSTFLGMSGSVQSTPFMKMKVDDIPDEQLTKVKEALAKQGNTSPSNDQILRTFWKNRTNG
jgi:soluble lytic murein transglycosylase